MPSILIIGNILHPTNTSQSAVSIQHSAFRYYEAFIQIWSLIQSSQAGRKTAAYSRIVYKLLEGYKQYIHVYTNYLNYLLILIQEVIQRCTPSECTHFSDAFLFENLLTSSLGPHIMQISINFFLYLLVCKQYSLQWTLKQYFCGFFRISTRIFVVFNNVKRKWSWKHSNRS